MKKLFIYIVVIIVNLFSQSRYLYADHIVGAQLTYECTGGNSYKFTLKVYVNCAVGGDIAKTEVSICSESCDFRLINAFTVSKDTVDVEVSPVCDGQLSNTTCATPPGTLPGILEQR